MSILTQETPWFRLEAPADEQSPVEVFLYDEIFDTGCDFFGGVCPSPFIEALTPFRDRDITVRINSPGGSMFAGLAIYNYLRSFPKLSTVVDSLSASAASVVGLAAPKARRFMARTAFIMIHEPSGFVFGPASEMLKMADTLAKLNDTVVELYARETGGKRDTLATQIAAETWLNGDDSLAAGFVGQLTDAPMVEARFELLSRYRSVPAKFREQQERFTMSTNARGATAPVITSCGCQGGTPAPTASTTELDTLKAENEQLKKDIEALKATEATATKARAEVAVQAAIDDGRLQPAFKDLMLAQYVANEPATVDLLAKLVAPKTTTGTEPVQVRGAGAGTATKSLREQIGSEPDVAKRIQMRLDNYDVLSDVRN